MKKTHDMSRYGLLYAVILLVFAFFSCSQQISGGSEIGNPAVMKGVVADSSGSGIPGVTLYLVSSGETDQSRLLPDSCMSTVSNSSGEYNFTSVSSGEYNILGIDTCRNGMFLAKVTVNTDNATVINGSPLIVNDTAIILAAGHLVLDTVLAGCAEGTVYIPGTPLFAGAAASGEYVITCPQAVIDIYHSGCGPARRIAQNCVIRSGKWTDLTGAGISVPAPGIVSGLLDGIAGRVYTFTAEDVSSDPNHPVQYRFDWGDAFSEWDYSVISTHVWSVSGTYQVRVQARSVRDTLSVSGWSVPVGVEIR